MIISKTPFRISFFGGGTDYPVWYREHGGAVLSTTIDKFCYITCRELPPFFSHRHKIVYSKYELVQSIDEIDHPAVREVMKFFRVQEGLEIHHDGDLPARSGLGSSSAFTVGLLHCIHTLRGETVTRRQLAEEAIDIEQNRIKENVGSQDQVAAAYGGFNVIQFSPDDAFTVTPVALPRERLNEFQAHLLFAFTGFTRQASKIAAEQIRNTKNRSRQLTEMQSLVGEAVTILQRSAGGFDDFGRLLHESWKLKRSLTDSISTDDIDAIYDAAVGAGAIGGKLIGAGGGGFMVFFAEPGAHGKIKEALNRMLFVPVKCESSGSQIIFSYRG